MGKKIVFTNTNGTAEEYAPKPADRFVPDWYKLTANRVPEKKTPESTPTIKKCTPVFDAITAGYIIVTPCDVYVTFKDGEPNYEPKVPGTIQFHPVKQAPRHPHMNEYPYPKWINPWAIKTPAGYSVYFKPPAHNPNQWFEILEGVVDTDTYSAPVNFPFVLKDPERECLIPAGTPMAQVIPFKRDSWDMELGKDIEETVRITSFLNSQFFDRYKRLFWHKKEYK